MIAMSNASRRHPLFVNEYFMRRAKSFMSTVIKMTLGIEHYWGRVEFAPGCGAIHLHIENQNPQQLLCFFIQAHPTRSP